MTRPPSLASLLDVDAIVKLARGSSVLRGREYFESGAVTNLARVGAKITANVRGTETYAVSIGVKGAALEHTCSCPMGGVEFCKHCVAVAIAWLAQEAIAPSPPSALDQPEGPPPGFFWLVPERLAVGDYPGSAREEDHEPRAHAVFAQGVRVFIDLTDDDEVDPEGRVLLPYAALVRDWAAACQERVACLHYGIRERSAPEEEYIQSIVDAIDLALDAKRITYIHSAGPPGRALTVAACWLLKEEDATVEDALAKLTELRGEDAVAVMTEAQRELLASWAGENGATEPEGV
jgi:hypothetical protein